MALRELKEFTKTIEAARSEVKAPVLDLGKRIDALAKELTQTLEGESDRLGRLIGSWQAEQNRIAEETRKRAEAEERRIWEEAKAKEKAEVDRLAAIETERQRVAKAEQDELLAKANRARSEAGRQKALDDAEALRIKNEIEADQRKQDEQRAAATRNQQVGQQMVAARVEGMNIVKQAPGGVATRMDVEFEVTDAKALFAAFPHLVTLTPNTPFIKAHLKQLPEGGTLVGVRWWKTAKTHARG